MSRLLLLLLCAVLLTASPVLAQKDTSIQYTEISSIALKVEQGTMANRIQTAYLSPTANMVTSYPEVKFTNGNIHPRFIPVDHIPQQALVRFGLSNTSDSLKKIWFFPGLYFHQINMYKETGNNSLELLPAITPQNSRETSYRLLELQPGDSAVFVAQLLPVRTHLNQIKPRLISEAYLPAFIVELEQSNPAAKIFTYLFCGLLLMMILFSFANYFMGKSLEFLFYSLYALFIGVMLFIKAVSTSNSTPFSFFQEGYLDFILQSVGNIFYMRFMQQYLNMRKKHTFLNQIYSAGALIVMISLIGFTFAHFFTHNFLLENYIENITKAALLVIIFIFLVYSVRQWDDRLLRYMFWGNLSLFVFSLMSLLLLTGTIPIRYLPSVLRSSIFYYELGILFELIFFLMGLNYKNRTNLIAQARERERLKAENLLNEYEKEIAVYKGQQEERQRISADMHDELGSGMTAIRLMSEIARNKMKENTPIEIEKISRSADEVLNKMNAIIWSMNSGNDSVDNLVSYIRAYALEYFEGTPITCRIFTPENINQRELSGDKRRNIFLCVKESLTNVLKHSKASEVRIYFVTEDVLTIKIVDNGVGIDLQKLRQFGNGLKNISKRMESIGGHYQIENKEGTVTTLRLKLLPEIQDAEA